ncbi:hypothetical protein BLA29_009520, partial [Euroglyphus maynei]
MEEYYVRDPEQIIVPHQKAAHILGQACPGCLTSAPSNSSITRLCTYIENSGGMVQEGLFRISGNAKLVDKLKHSFDNNGDAPLETDGDLAAAAALLKQFLRELPQPLIPNETQFLDVIRSLKNDHETCVLSLKALVSQLPDENYYTLRYLIRFLHRIAQRNEENRMTS